MSGKPLAAETPIETVLARLELSPRGLLILALCVLVAMAEGYDVQAMAMAAPMVAKAWSLRTGEIGLLLTASVAGLVAGSVLLAPAGDRVGRRPATLAGLLLAGGATLAGAYMPNVGSLLAVRVLAGFGLGLAMPNVIALAMEWQPLRWRTLAIVAVGCGYPIGASVGGAIASRMIGDHGFPIVFVIGGVSTLGVMVAALLGLPESPLVLARSPAHAVRLKRLLAALRAPVSPTETITTLGDHEAGKVSVSALFVPERRSVTLLLWLLNFATFAMVYFFVSWLPSLLAYRGLEPSAALKGIAAFNGSGVLGGLVMAILLPKLGPTRVLGAAYVLAGAGILALGLGAANGAALYGAIAMAGVGIVGSQFCLIAVVNQFYPAQIRVGAAGWALGIGRLGAIVAPLAGAALLANIHSLERVFLVTAVPSLVALAAIITLHRTRGISQVA